MEVDSSETAVYAGQLLVQNLNEMTAGEGTYVYLQKIYSQYNGTVKVTKAGNSDTLDNIAV